MKKFKWFSIYSVLLLSFFIQISIAQNIKIKDIAGKWEKGSSKLTFSTNGTFVTTYETGLSTQVFKGTFKIEKSAKKQDMIVMIRANGKPHATYFIESLSEDKKKLKMSYGATTAEIWSKK